VLGGRDPQGPDVDLLPWAQAVVSGDAAVPAGVARRTRRRARRRHLGRPGFRRRHRRTLAVPSSPPSRILAQPREIRPATILTGQHVDPSAVCVPPVRRRSPHLSGCGTGPVGGDANAGRPRAVRTHRTGADDTPAPTDRRHPASADRCSLPSHQFNRVRDRLQDPAWAKRVPLHIVEHRRAGDNAVEASSTAD
jgi:hypothetical protein